MIFSLTSLGKGGTNAPTIFKIALKKLFHIDSELLRSRDSKSWELRYLGYFWKISQTYFFFKSRVFLIFRRENFNFFTIKPILRGTLFLNRLHDFSFLSSHSFIHPFLKSKFTKKNCLTPRKFYFQRLIFNNNRNFEI